MSSSSLAGMLSLGLLALQLPPTFLLLSRLFRGARRQPPIPPRTAVPTQRETASVIVPTGRIIPRRGDRIPDLKDPAIPGRT